MYTVLLYQFSSVQFSRSVMSYSLQPHGLLHVRLPCPSPSPGASLLAQLVKNAPAMQETQVRSLGWEDPLEKGKATHSSSLTWRIPWTTVQGVAKSQI